ncbi:glutaminase, partial [Klebsiella pneumoniae]
HSFPKLPNYHHDMAIAVWSPELDDAGNSLAGVAILEKLTQRMGRSVF